MTTLLLLHAFPLGPQMWSPLIDHLDLPTLAPAFPGFAGRELLVTEPSLADFAQDALKQSDDDLIVAGCSMGGYVAMEMMRIAPERLVGVILMDTKADADQEGARSRRLEVAAGVESDGMAPWVDALFAPLLGSASQEQRQSLVLELRELIANANPQGVAWAQRAMSVRPDSQELLQRWAKPALVIVGAEDQLSPVAMAQSMAELLPQGELAIIGGAGHLSPWEAPQDVADAIKEWISKNGLS
jgi:pimeloyl-ACP methyl ester carboxylesterase